MKKLKLILLVTALIFFAVACKDSSTKNDYDRTETDVVVDQTDTDLVVDDTDIGNTGNTVNDSDADTGDTGSTENRDTDDKGNTGTCQLKDGWMSPEDSWTSWSQLKILGPIGDYEDDYIEIAVTDGIIKLASETNFFTDGFLVNYQSDIIADVSSCKSADVDYDKGTLVFDCRDAMFQFPSQLITDLKEKEMQEAGVGANVFLFHTYKDAEFNAAGIVTSEQTRKSCYLAVSKTEEIEEDGDMYDVPIGDMYGCFEDNVDGSVGENLKMMFKNELVEDQASLLEYVNTQEDGTILEYGDNGFQHVCQCYDEFGTEVNCWDYDGPGGVEECPDYVPEGDC